MGEKEGGVIVRERKRCYAGTGTEMSNIWKRWKEDKENMEEESGAKEAELRLNILLNDYILFLPSLKTSSCTWPPNCHLMKSDSDTTLPHPSVQV